MITKKIKLGNIREVEAFNQICSKFTCDMDLSSGKYYVNAKSGKLAGTGKVDESCCV